MRARVVRGMERAMEGNMLKNFMTLGYLGIASYFDFRWKRVPWILQLSAFVLTGLVWGYEVFSGRTFLTLAGVAFSLAPGSVILLLAFVTREQIGYGDGISVLILGAMYGFYKCMGIVCAGLFLVSLTGIVCMALKKAGRHTRLPFLPFLLSADLLFLIFEKLQ